MFIPDPDLGLFTHPGSRGQKGIRMDPGSGFGTLRTSGVFSMFRFILEQTTPEILSETFGIPLFCVTALQPARAGGRVRGPPHPGYSQHQLRPPAQVP
jgi:hypothetical protein